MFCITVTPVSEAQQLSFEWPHIGHRVNNMKQLKQLNKQYQMKVQLNSFHKNGHTLGFLTQLNKS